MLRIALTDLADLNHPEISKSVQEQTKRAYRRLAFLGDALLDSVLADYLYGINPELTQDDFNYWRATTASRESLVKFAIELGLPNFSSSWNKKSRKPPEEERKVWGEMFEAVVGVIFLDRERDFGHLSAWLVDRFIRGEIGAEVGDPNCNTTISTADILT